jgi:hypothetical protein
LERRQNALLNHFPKLQNYGNFQTQFDFSIDIEDNEKPEKIPNIDLEPTYKNDFKILEDFFESSKILSEYIHDMGFLFNKPSCPFQIASDSY